MLLSISCLLFIRVNYVYPYFKFKFTEELLLHQL